MLTLSHITRGAKLIIYFSETENDVNDTNVTVEKQPERKPLPDLDKYWKAVNDDPSDFTGWTYLLQYVEQEVSYKKKKQKFEIQNEKINN